MRVALWVAAALIADTLWILCWDAWNTDRNWGKPLQERGRP